MSTSLPHATRVLDCFHVTKLGFDVVDQVRRRVQQQSTGHRGRREDKLFRARRVLRRRADRLSPRAWARLLLLLDLGDVDQQIGKTWIAAQDLQQVFDAHDRRDAEQRLHRWLTWCAESEVAELHRLARTIDSWREELLAYFHAGHVTNGPTESTNLLVKKIKRSGHGFRNFDNYRLRLLLHCGVTWRDHRPAPLRGRLRRSAASSRFTRSSREWHPAGVDAHDGKREGHGRRLHAFNGCLVPHPEPEPAMRLSRVPGRVRSVRRVAVPACVLLAVGGAWLTPAAITAAVAATTNPSPAGGARNGATRLPFTVSDSASLSVDVGTGNVLFSQRLMTLPGINSDVPIALSYNSTGALTNLPSYVDGASSSSGWSISGYDQRLVINADSSVTYEGPTGLTGVFVPVTGSTTGAYTSPTQFRDTLVKNADGTFTLTNHVAQSVLTFSSAGHLRTAADRNGNTTTFGYGSASPYNPAYVLTSRGGPFTSGSPAASIDTPAGISRRSPKRKAVIAAPSVSVTTAAAS